MNTIVPVFFTVIPKMLKELLGIQTKRCVCVCANLAYFRCAAHTKRMNGFHMCVYMFFSLDCKLWTLAL